MKEEADCQNLLNIYMYWTAPIEKDFVFLRLRLRDYFREEDMSGIELIYSLKSPVKTEINHFAPIRPKIATLSNQIIKFRRTRDLMLPRPLSGKVDLSKRSA